MKKFVLCGAGRVGRKIADILKENNKHVTIIERDREIVKELKEEGHDVILGDVLDDETFKKVGLNDAKWVIATLGNDIDNLFVVFKSKELNPKVKIAARVCSEESIETFYRSGADLLVMPELIGGLHLAKAILGLESPEKLETVESKKEYEEKKIKP